jgi:hypothetical protein
VQETVIVSIKRILDFLVEMYSVPPDLQIIRGTSSLNNNKDTVDYVAARVRSLTSPNNVVELHDPSMV